MHPSCQTLGTTPGSFGGHQAPMKTKIPSQSFHRGSHRQASVGFRASRLVRHVRPSAVESHLAGLGSAERVAPVEHGPDVLEKVSSSSGRRSRHRCVLVPPSRRLTGSRRRLFSCPADLKRVQVGCGNSNPPWPRPPWRVVPNPSFKPSPNGGSRWPSSAGPAAHFALAVQHAPPSVPS